MSSTATVNDKVDFSPLEAGEYLMRMQRISEVTSKAGNPMIKASFQVIKRVGGEADEKGVKNRLIFENFVMEHTNPIVGEIARERLGKYAEAIGITEDLDGDFSVLGDYLETPFIGKVKIKEGNNGYPDSNSITSFKSR